MAIEVVNVVGMTEANAKSALSGLDINVIYGSDSSKANGVVLKQSVSGGTTLTKGDKITITVNRVTEVTEPEGNTIPEEPTTDPEEPVEGTGSEEPTTGSGEPATREIGVGNN